MDRQKRGMAVFALDLIGKPFMPSWFALRPNPPRVNDQRQAEVVVFCDAAFGGPKPRDVVARRLDADKSLLDCAQRVPRVVDENQTERTHKLCRKLKLGPNVFLAVDRVE